MYFHEFWEGELSVDEDRSEGLFRTRAHRDKKIFRGQFYHNRTDLSIINHKTTGEYP
jgi:hypothetical protein